MAVPALGSAAAIAAVALTHTAVDLTGGTVSALMPTIRHRFHLSAAGIGALIAVVAVCTSMAQPLAGRIADRLGAKRVAATGAVLSSVLLSMLGVADHVWIVVALIVVGGLFTAGYHPASVVMARRVLPDRAQLAVSLFSAGGMLGLAVGPLAVLLIAAHAGIGFTPLLMVPGVVLGGVMWHFLPADPPPVARDRTAKRQRSILRGPVGALTLASALAALAATTFSAGLPLWLTEHAGLDIDSAAIGVTLALFQIGAVAGGLLSGYLSCRILPSRLCFMSLILAAPALALGAVHRTGGTGLLRGCDRCRRIDQRGGADTHRGRSRAFATLSRSGVGNGHGTGLRNGRTRVRGDRTSSPTLRVYEPRSSSASLPSFPLHSSPVALSPSDRRLTRLSSSSSAVVAHVPVARASPLRTVVAASQEAVAAMPTQRPRHAALSSRSETTREPAQGHVGEHVGRPAAVRRPSVDHQRPRPNSAA